MTSWKGFLCKKHSLLTQISQKLTHSGLAMPNEDIELCQHWLKEWLVAWWHQAITWTNVDLSSIRFSDSHLRAIEQEIPQPSVLKMAWKLLKSKISFKSHRGQWAITAIHDICQQWFVKSSVFWCYIDGLMQERRNSIANALELRLSCTNPLI